MHPPSVLLLIVPTWSACKTPGVEMATLTQTWRALVGSLPLNPAHRGKSYNIVRALAQTIHHGLTFWVSADSYNLRVRLLGGTGRFLSS